jgi:hypothetical protein
MKRTKFDLDLPGLVRARERQDSQADRAVPESEAERVPTGYETGTRAEQGPFAYDSDAGKRKNVHQADESHLAIRISGRNRNAIAAVSVRRPQTVP